MKKKYQAKYCKEPASIAVLPLPGWLFAALMVVYHELMLHIWVTETVEPWRLLTVVLFAAGFGCAVALLTTLIPNPKAGKWIAAAASFLVTVIWLTEYFVMDAYKVFMTPTTIIGGAGGVAGDYFDLVASLLVRNLWRIGAMLLPAVLFLIFCKPVKTTWRARTALAVCAVAAYLGGFAAAGNFAGGMEQFGTTYEFDSAVRGLGLNMGLSLEIAQGSVEDKDPVFVAAPTQAPTLPAPTQPPSPAETVGEETVETTAPEIVYGDQVMEGVDFAALAQNAPASKIKSVYEYLASQTPAKKNEYTGLFAGKNLIFITAEAFTAEAIDPELTPTLYRLANQGIKFTDYYQPAWGASTTSGEFSNIMGIVPTNGGACMKEAIQQPMFMSMGFQLQNLGYRSLAYHANDATFYERHRTHVRLGYDEFIAIGTGLTGLSTNYPYSDLELMNLTIDDYIDNQPFSVYYMSFSGHSPYSQKSNDHCAIYYDQVAHLDHSETVKNYLACQLDFEAALTVLVERLEAAGIADDTVIVISTDHYPYGLEKSNTWKNTTDHLAELYGVDRYDSFLRDHNALIIWSGCLEGKNIVVEDPVYSLDIVPTLSNLFGVNYDSRLLVGRDVFSDEEPLVLWKNQDWITDKGRYKQSSRTFTPAPGVSVEEGYVERINAKVANKVIYSQSVINHDFFRHFYDAVKDLWLLPQA